MSLTEKMASDSTSDPVVLQAHRRLFDQYGPIWCLKEAEKVEKCVQKHKVNLPTVYNATLNPELSCHCKGKAERFFDCMDDEITKHLYKVAEMKCAPEVRECALRNPGDLSRCRNDPAIQICGASKLDK